MAAISVTELPQARGSFPSEGEQSMDRVFDVFMDGPGYYPDQVIGAVLTAYGLSYGVVHPSYPALLSSFEPEQQSDSRSHWRVTARYSTKPPNDPNQQENDPNRDPLLDPPEVSWVTKQREMAIDRDIFGNPILNYAKRPYDPALTVWVPVCVLRVSRNEANATYSQLGPYLGKTNSVEFLGGEPYHVLCADIQATKQRKAITSGYVQNGDNNSGVTISILEYWRVTYEFEFIDVDETDPLAGITSGPWDARIFQADFEQLNAAGDGTEPILDDNGDPVRTPWPIDADGRAIAKDNLPDDAVYKRHSIRKPVDFNQLGITI